MQIQRSNKIKQALTRTLALTLSVLMFITSAPLTAHATGVGDTGGNTGGGGGTMGNGYTTSLAWNKNKQGYRMYIINSDFIRISKVYDFYYSEPEGVGNMSRDTRFDGSDSPVTGMDENLFWISKLQEWCDSDKEVPPPVKFVGADSVGNGQEFKDWFFDGRAGTTISTTTPDGNRRPGGTKPGGNPGTDDNQSYDRKVFAPDINTDNWGNFIDAIAVIDSGELGLYPEGVISQHEYELMCDYCEQMRSKQNSYYNSLKDNIGKWVDTDYDGVGDYQVAQESINDYSNNLAINYVLSKAGDNTLANYAVTLYLHGEAELLRYCRIGTSPNDVDWSDDDIKYTIPNDPNPMYRGSYDTQSLLFQDIPLSSGEGGGSGMPAYNLINKENTIQVPRYRCAGDAIEDGCYLVVEPITWLNVRINNGPWESTSTYNSYRTYGTYWNLAQNWVGSGGFYNTIMTELFNNCLTTSTLITSKTGKTLSPVADSNSQKSVEESRTMMNSSIGLSMHIYDANDFLGGDLDIYKVYQDKNGNHQQTHHVKGNNPYKAEDESPYKLIEWETSTVKPTTDPPTSTPWSTLISGKPVVQNGTTTTTITPGDTEKAIYILYKESPITTPVDGDWVLTESQLSKHVTTGSKTSLTSLPFTCGSLSIFKFGVSPKVCWWQ